MPEKTPVLKVTSETWLRKTFKTPLDKVANFMLKRGLRPNHITLTGLAGDILAAVLVAKGYLVWGGVVALLVAPLDALDGAMARQLGTPSRFGSFLDSVIDRYDELFLLAGLLYYFVTQDNPLGIMLTYGAAAGSVLVSYLRAKAEALEFSAKVGILTRIERSIVMLIGLLFRVPLVSVGIIAVLANVTALQRFFSVYKQSKQ